MNKYELARSGFAELDILFCQGDELISKIIASGTDNDNGDDVDFSHVVFIYSHYGVWYARHATYDNGFSDVLLSAYVANNPDTVFHPYRLKQRLTAVQHAAIMTRSGQLLSRPYGTGQLFSIALDIIGGGEGSSVVGDDSKLICTEGVERSFFAYFDNAQGTVFEPKQYGVKLTDGVGFDDISPNLQSTSDKLEKAGDPFTFSGDNVRG